MREGVYVLIISVNKDIGISVGALGIVNFRKGMYGSAQKNLEKRLIWHLRKIKAKFWHIDYLLDNDAVKVLKVFYKRAGRLEECEIAKKLGERGTPIKDFGSSDCKCTSPLFKLRGCQFLIEFMHETALII